MRRLSRRVWRLGSAVVGLNPSTFGRSRMTGNEPSSTNAPPKRRNRACRRGTALIIVLSVAAAQTSHAGTTSPNTPPSPAPNPVTFGQLPTETGVQCAGQLTQAINTANDVNVAASATSAAGYLTAWTAEQVGGDADAGSFAALSAGLGVTVGYGDSPAPTVAGIPGSIDASVASGVLAASSGAEAIGAAAGTRGRDGWRGRRGLAGHLTGAY